MQKFLSVFVFMAVMVGGLQVSQAADCVLTPGAGTYEKPQVVKPSGANRYWVKFGDGAWTQVRTTQPDGSVYFVVQRTAKVSVKGYKGNALECENLVDVEYTILAPAPAPVAKRVKKAVVPAAPAAAPAAPAAIVEAVEAKVPSGLPECPALDMTGRRSDHRTIADNAPRLCSARVSGVLRVFHLENSQTQACVDGLCQWHSTPGWYRLVADANELEALSRELRESIAYVREGAEHKGAAKAEVADHEIRLHPEGFIARFREGSFFTKVGLGIGAGVCGIASAATYGLALGWCVPALAVGGGGGVAVDIVEAAQ